MVFKEALVDGAAAAAAAGAAGIRGSDGAGKVVGCRLGGALSP
jgi:hypothetical protein